MTAKTITPDDPTMNPADLQAEFAALSLRVSQGDATAEKPLAAVEARLDLITRTESRGEAAMAEERRLESEAQRQATIAAHTENVRLHGVALEARDRAYSLVEQVTEELIQAVKLSIKIGR